MTIKQKTLYDCMKCCLAYFIGEYPDYPCPTEYMYERSKRINWLWYTNKGLRKYNKKVYVLIGKNTENWINQFPTTFKNKTGNHIAILRNNHNAHAVVVDKDKNILFDPSSCIVPTRIIYDLKDKRNYYMVVEDLK
jgi:hypothetical protein